MKPILLSLGFLMLFLSACNYPPANDNHANLSKLHKGMTRAEVVAVMGGPHQGQGTFARNPDIWYYYTQTVWRDGNITPEECTPLCFHPRTGKLIGWGNAFCRKFELYGEWRKKEWESFDNPTFDEP